MDACFIVIDKNKVSSPAIDISQEEKFRQANRKRLENDKLDFKFFDSEDEANEFKAAKPATYPAVDKSGSSSNTGSDNKSKARKR